jgi:DNA-binding NtrC family response regulator
MERTPQILICDDDATFHLAVKHSLKSKYECRTAYNGDEAMAIVKNHPVDAMILDVQMRTSDEGLRYIPRFLEIDPEMAIVMSSGLTDFNTVREAMRLGATDYVAKNFDPNELQITIAHVLERRSLLKRHEQQNFEAVSHQRQHILIGETPPIELLRRTIRPVRMNVVITGETGTGKEVIARQLRRTLSDGTLEPFVAVDSATIQSSTAESQLFGHEKGAFTGADHTKKGIFEEANGGVVYFDEIANMPLEIQAKLLRVLQEKEVTRLGSSRVLALEFRVIAATNKNLEEMARVGQFKDDLLQRLNVIPIELSPLRERRDDIPRLVVHFMEKHLGRSGALTVTDEALDVLRAYSWPGNVRELSNLVGYLTAMTDGTEVDIADLPPKLRDAARAEAMAAASLTSGASQGSFYDQVADFERKLLVREYEHVEGNVSRLALTLGMDRSHLYSKLREYGIHGGRTRAP